MCCCVIHRVVWCFVNLNPVQRSNVEVAHLARPTRAVNDAQV